jgi:hypothetical protein
MSCCGRVRCTPGATHATGRLINKTTGPLSRLRAVGPGGLTSGRGPAHRTVRRRVGTPGRCREVASYPRRAVGLRRAGSRRPDARGRSNCGAV